ncbi:ubiquinone/menaquinone biosynthesis C-methylase UbiE [Povalibacter uvarum]|uniref:Ubiquinone/menaquinone biosynthesis C-methylase UbiE n=1 Tax=Povalibacter uvarum TaxID=732238 RepID=A0A841HEW9_9GAMM|nr:class I SAM-dependent methyltransferase [Povalibacter uvarum]MBB6091661.1 ubiquinone/menaquinone biosynthesis C-methylase UbiE [Povalibacter uvarum]
MKLLPESALVRTGPVDHADWNYRPFIGTVQRIRFRLIRRLLAGRQFNRLLEIGYGSGVFMPELAQRASELYGIDPHPMPREVEAALAKHGIKATLATAGAESLPFEDGFFDCAVSVSAIEYVDDIDKACRELIRVMKPGGVIAIATPGVSPIWDLALKLSTGESPKQYSDRRQRLLPALKRHFKVEDEVFVPPIGGKLVRLYTGVSLLRA